MPKNNHANVFVKQAFRRFFIPSLLAQLGLAIGGIADCIFVGNAIGVVGLTAISISQPVYLLFNTISYSLSIGGSIRYAAALSEGKEKEGNRIFGNVIRFAFFTYLLLCGLGLLFLPQLLRFLGAGAPGTQVWECCRQVVRAQLLLIPLMFLQGPFYYFINCDNRPKLAAVALVTSSTLDVLFNYIFVVRMKIGIVGSVYATGVGAAAMVLISLTHFLFKKGCLRFTWPAFDFKEVFCSFKTGFATSIQHIFQFVTILFCNRMLMRLSGELGVAVLDIVFNVTLLTASVYDALSMALQPMISTFRGERNRQNIRETLGEAVKVSVIMSVILTAVLELFPGAIGQLFGLRGAAELASGKTAIRIYAIGILASGFNMLMTYYYQALEQEKISYLLFTLRSFVLFLLYACLFGNHRLNFFWWTYPATEFTTLAFLIRYNRDHGSWTYLPGEEHDVFTCTIYREHADLGQVEQQVNTYMEGMNASTQQTYYVTMMVEEVCGVILDKASAEYIQLTLVPHEDGTVTLQLRDNAKRFNPFEVSTENIDLMDEIGLDALGVKLVKKKAKEFFYRQYAGFNTLVVRI